METAVPSVAHCLLRTVSSGKKITKKQAEILWKEGKLVGLFNIPFENQNLFESCVDFGIEVEYMNSDESRKQGHYLSITDLMLIESTQLILELQRRNSLLQETNKEILKNIAKLKEQIAKLQTESLTKEADQEQERQKITKQKETANKKLIEVNKFVNEVNEKLKKEQEEHQNTSTKLEKQIQQLQKELEKERKQRVELEQNLEWSRDEKEKVLQEFKTMAFILEEKQKVVKEKNETNNQIQQELDESKKLVKDLIGQNKELSQRLKEIRISRDKLLEENENYKSVFHISVSQNDQLNKHLLQSFQNMNIPRAQVNAAPAHSRFGFKLDNDSALSDSNHTNNYNGAFSNGSHVFSHNSNANVTDTDSEWD